MSTRVAVSPDGTRIAYDVAGSGPALLLLHGGGLTRQSWHEAGYVARLQPEVQVISVDQRGNGESDRPVDAAAYSIAKLGDDILAVADACGVERFTLWGFSYGGNVGRYLAARSDRVARFILIGIPFGLAAGGEFRARILDIQARWAPIVAALRAGTLDPATLTAEQQETLARRDVVLDLAWLSAMLDWPMNEPADMRCPTLWLVGTENVAAMQSVQKYETAITGTKVQVLVVPGLTHMQEFSEIDQVLPPMLGFTRAT